MKRTTEQVHDEDGHATPVASCSRCQTEAEADRNAELGREQLAAAGDSGPVEDEEIAVIEEAHAEAADGEQAASAIVGEQGPELYAGVRQVAAGDEGPLPEVDPAGYADDAVQLDATPSQLDPASALAGDGRPACRVKRCELPEFADDMGLCGAHWSTRPDLRKEARRG